MISRYNLMVASSVYDEDNDPFPDVLSVDYNLFKYSIPAVITLPDTTMASKPYYTTYSLYKTTEMEDILYNILNIPYCSLILNEDQVSFPDKKDFLNFIHFYTERK